MSLFGSNKEEIRQLSKQIGALVEEVEQLKMLSRIRKYDPPDTIYSFYTLSNYTDFTLREIVEKMLTELGLCLEKTPQPTEKFRIVHKEQK